MNDNQSAREGQSAAYWAGSVARAQRVASLSGDLFWGLTPAEVEQILREAIGEWRDKARAASYNAAMVCACLYNCHRDPKAHPEPFTPADFLPQIEKPQPKDEIDPELVAQKVTLAMNVLTQINS